MDQQPQLKKSKPEQIDKNHHSSDEEVIVADQHREQSIFKLKAEGDAEGEELNIKYESKFEVTLPAGYPYTPIAQHIPNDPPAKTYPFTLDSFQRLAIYSIERNESVLVSAHTSAGKTVVAEYAIAQSLKNKQRVVYTSPIKALSNQKFREFQLEFKDVGLMTGDISINPNASCLVMTTEILRSMLYKGSEITREIAWIIFDEIHYMRDLNRGVVWEECISLASKTRFVFLSATIPNSMQFARWITQLHNQPCHVVYTDFRPTPLQHYIFPQQAEGIYLVVDEHGKFREKNFNTALQNIKQNREKKGKVSHKDIHKIVKMIMVRNYDPVIVFSFSKADCESLALQMMDIDLNNDQESTLVEEVFNNAISTLNEDDRDLPQIQHILPLLKRGIGIHHSGLLPILKEVIEILFQEGLLKILFATETFSIGLNMPAKTVLFTSVEKYDGKKNRFLTSGEYIQMSGRAGRRGLDDRGIVIMMVDLKIKPEIISEMIKGESNRLDSAFHLTYNMLLNIMRVDGGSPEKMLQRSFFQFQCKTLVPKLKQKLDMFENELKNLHIPDLEKIINYYRLNNKKIEYENNKAEIISHPTYALPFLSPGRMIFVKHNNIEYGWAVVIGFEKLNSNDNIYKENNLRMQYLIDVFMEIDIDSNIETKSGNPYIDSLKQKIIPPKKDSQTKSAIISITLNSIFKFSQVRLNLPDNLNSEKSMEFLKNATLEVKKRFKDEIPILSPTENMGITDEKFIELLKKLEILDKKIKKHEINKKVDKQNQLLNYERKKELEIKIMETRSEILKAEQIVQLEDLKRRKRVLRRLGFISSTDIIEIKGRVACEINSGDELILTDLLFQGVFNSLTPEQCVGLLSCFVCEEKENPKNSLPEEMQTPIKLMKESAAKIAHTLVDCKTIEIKEEEYVDMFKTSMVNITLAWCNGAKFSEICAISNNTFEGSIIRCFRRLDELLHEMQNAAKTIGNPELQNKFATGVQMIKRDIVFSASLYL